MNRPAKSVRRLARLLAAQLQAPAKPQPLADRLPTSDWDEIAGLCRRIDEARQRGWFFAARRLAESLDYLVSACCRHLELFRAEAPQSLAMAQSLSVGDALRDLAALRDEFADVEYDPEEHELRVTTEPIELRDIYLGRFQICLDVKAANQRPDYRVVALDPNPAASNSDVTHPHVSDEALCEGEGGHAIRLALAQRRLYDFFVLVSRVLATYASGQAYVELDDWERSATTCEQCGDRIDDDEADTCDRCGESVCGSCSNYCSSCDSKVCSGCDYPCSSCESSCCHGCLEKCRRCSKTHCSGCLEDGLCPKCHEHETQNTADSVAPLVA